MTGIRRRKRLLVIGLDGVPIELIRLYTADGTMPVLNQLFSEYPPVSMNVSIPDVSAVSWSGFMTGRDSGHHGIFGFTDLEENSYRLKFPDFRDLKEKPFFMDKQTRPIVVNLPATYPAPPHRGILISGFVAPELKKAVWPPALYPLVKESGYAVDVDCSHAHLDPDGFFSDLHTILRQRLDLAVHLMRNEEWNLFMFTVTGTDRLHHFFFDAWDLSDHPRHENFRGYYSELDLILGELLQEARLLGPFEWLILSDHGFAPLHTQVNINPLLREWGFAEKETSDPEGMLLPVRHSRAFAMDPARIYLHIRGRFPQGRVDPRDSQRLLDELATKFTDLHFNGRAVIKAVHRRDEVYAIPQRHKAPDLVLEGAPGFDLKAGFLQESAFSTGRFRGTHRRDNAFLACSRPGLVPVDPTIFQVRRIIEGIQKGR